MTGIFGLLNSAARGDVGAQRALADRAVEIINEDPDVCPYTALSEGLVFARLAAVHGDNNDEARVVVMLTMLAALQPAAGQVLTLGEALARYSRLADRGGEMPGARFEDVMATFSANTMAAAQAYQQAFKQGETV